MINLDRVIAVTQDIPWLCNYYAARPRRKYMAEDWHDEPYWLGVLCRGVNRYVDSHLVMGDPVARRLCRFVLKRLVRTADWS